MNKRALMLRAELWRSRVSGRLGFPVGRHLPQGLSLVSDIKRLLPKLTVTHVFDVGANIGQSALMFSAAFPRARIEAFEPVASTFEQLKRNAPRDTRCHKLALSAKPGTLRMASDELSELSRVSETGEEVPVETLDRFCEAGAIERISLLKIDTEGHDVDVLVGAQGMLELQRIDLVQVEAGMNPENQLHVYFEKFFSLLLPIGYRLFGIYEQCFEWPTNTPTLRRCNLVFGSGELMKSKVR
jgi:FkbM family methyltransferase